MATQTTTVQITMPAMGESVTEGTVLEWLKQVGDAVTADEPLVEVSTDKVDAEVPSPATGTLVKILVEPDQTVQVGAPLGEIEVGGEPAAAGAARSAGRERARGRRVSRRWATRWPRARCSSGASRSATRSRWTTSSWRSRPTRSTPRCRRRWPGTLSEILVQADETVAVGTTLCRIAAGAGAAPAGQRARGTGRGAQGRRATARGHPPRPASRPRWPHAWRAPTGWT